MTEDEIEAAAKTAASRVEDFLGYAMCVHDAVEGRGYSLDAIEGAALDAMSECITEDSEDLDAIKARARTLITERPDYANRSCCLR